MLRLGFRFLLVSLNRACRIVGSAFLSVTFGKWVAWLAGAPFEWIGFVIAALTFLILEALLSSVRKG